MKYFTTPIYYVNGNPHIGHAYTSIAADILSRFWRTIEGEKVKFLTGTDEHGQKVAKSAEKLGIKPLEFCDKVSMEFKNLTSILNLSNDDFIRTTEERHKNTVIKMWNILLKNGYIYKDFYEGWYSVKDEAFVPENEVKDGHDLSGNKLEYLKEESYFFKLSSMQDKLLKFYDENKDFITPSFYMNEVVSFVKGGMKDLSISRTSFDWGIKVPNDEKHVMYVWLDALCNYISAISYDNPDKIDFDQDLWDNSYHLIGKDILRFHAVYWPAFLIAAEINPPKKLIVHGWWRCNGEKMSKSLGNVVDPIEVIKTYGLDQFRFFLFKESVFGTDCNFSVEHFKTRINTELCNDFGNLIQRVFVLALKSTENSTFIFSRNYDDHDIVDYVSSVSDLKDNLEKFMKDARLTEYLKEVFEKISLANKFVDKMKPWELLKTDLDKFKKVITALIDSIIEFSAYLYPYMPETINKVFATLNISIDGYMKNKNIDSVVISKPTPLFKKID